MGKGKGQAIKWVTVCQCGCLGIFTPFPIYLGKKRPVTVGKYLQVSGSLYIPLCKRGHGIVTSFAKGTAPWNKGLNKTTCPTISRMGFQPGHAPHNDWSRVNWKLTNDPTTRSKWLASKKGQVAWNKGKTAKDTPSIRSGGSHPAWKGGITRWVDSQERKAFTLAILMRDSFTCQQCGDRNRRGRGSRINLEVHHLIPVLYDPSRIADPDNCTTLCRSCHFKTDTYGAKAIRNHPDKQGGS